MHTEGFAAAGTLVTRDQRNNIHEEESSKPSEPREGEPNLPNEPSEALMKPGLPWLPFPWP